MTMRGGERQVYVRWLSFAATSHPRKVSSVVHSAVSYATSPRPSQLRGRKVPVFTCRREEAELSETHKMQQIRFVSIAVSMISASLISWKREGVSRTGKEKDAAGLD